MVKYGCSIKVQLPLQRNRVIQLSGVNWADGLVGCDLEA